MPPDSGEVVRLCPVCAAEIRGGSGQVFCTHCGAVSQSQPVIRVEGMDADEVERVARRLADDQRQAERRAAARLRSPWLTGSFYLLVLIVAAAILLVAARVVPVWTVPVIALTSLLAVAIVGAFQLRQDDRLGEREFVELMALTLKRLPLLARGPRASADK